MKGVQSQGNITFLEDYQHINISSSQIRGLIKQKKSVRFLVPDSVLELIERSGYYQ
jgi:nicotinic acid mononucleotide adenylyltransferase